jgi:signal transduction histidine kinase
MAVWTVFTIWRYRIRFRRTNTLVFLDQVVVSVLFLLGSLVWLPQENHSQPSVVSDWLSTMPLVAGVQWGMIAGGVSGVFAASFLFVTRYFALSSVTFTNMLLLIGAGVVVGIAADAVRRSTERLAGALRAESANAERERLAQSIHDNVLQVLAHVRRRGNELGGEAAELARMAGEQEIALRTLMATPPPRITDNGDVDFGVQLQTMRSASVEVSVPAESVLLPESMASELVAVTREALANVAKHAGPDAKAWVLLENLGSAVVLSVRDNGLGIPPGRLDEAVTEGRMGVAQSIRGRVRSLGGTIELDTTPGEGTEWEIRVPHPIPAGQQSW